MSIVTDDRYVASAAARQMTRGEQRKIVFAAVIGNLLEFFDFTVYSYFALTIGRQAFRRTIRSRPLCLPSPYSPSAL